MGEGTGLWVGLALLVAGLTAYFSAPPAGRGPDQPRFRAAMILLAVAGVAIFIGGVQLIVARL